MAVMAVYWLCGCCMVVIKINLPLTTKPPACRLLVATTTLARTHKE